MKFSNILFGLLLLLCLATYSCNPRITSSLVKDYPSLKYDEKVEVIALSEKSPKNAEVLGEVKARDTGFSTKCNYEIVLDKAKLEARKAGGNAIKITRHKTPSIWSTCHRIDATILRITN